MVHRQWGRAVLAFITVFAASPALACRMAEPLDPTHVKYADVVVVGSIANYRLVLDQHARKAHRNWALSQTGFVTDYARFDVIVETALLGQASGKISAILDDLFFAEPTAMGEGRYVIALRRVTPNQPLRVLQGACAPVFVFPVASAEAAAMRKALRSRPN